MATRQGRQRQTTYRQTTGGAYVYGNTVRQLDVKRAIEEEPRRQVSPSIRKNRDKAIHMNFGYVLFLVASLVITGMVLINYIQLQSQMTNSVDNIAKLESQLNDLKLANDEEYSRIVSSVDLEEIKRIAIGELGMTYAQEGQIITYSGENSDYVKQVADIPQ